MQLKYQQDFRSILNICLTLAMLLTPHLIDIPVHATLPWIICSSFLCFIASIINHNHMHCCMFVSKSLNLSMNIALSLARGHSATGIIVPHQLNHHIESCSEKDWIRPSLAGSGPGWLRILRYIVMASFTMMLQRNKPDAPVLGQRLRVSLGLERFFLASVITLAVFSDWKIFLLFNAIPWLAGLSMLVGVNLLQHDGCDQTVKFGESRNFTGSIGNWLFFNNGFHTVHHLKPYAHWSELPDIHSSIRTELPNHDLEHASILSYLWKFLWSRNRVLGASE